MKTGMVPRSLWLDPKFKALNPSGKLVLLYALTCPLGNSAHLFRVGPDEIALGCNMPIQQTNEILSTLSKAGFLAYDLEHELLWLESQMVAELGATLKSGDKRISFLRKLIAELPECPIKADFLARYSDSYHLGRKGACKGASIPLRSQGQGQGQGQSQSQSQDSAKKEGNSNSELTTTPARGATVSHIGDAS